ncbi:hypothetical protein MN608_04274 [Microdochium nivale]|nr:hypothetical protein MN608_04274 [Microdochium nivale]
MPTSLNKYQRQHWNDSIAQIPPSLQDLRPSANVTPQPTLANKDDIFESPVSSTETIDDISSRAMDRISRQASPSDIVPPDPSITTNNQQHQFLDFGRPPTLNYTLADKKLRIFFFWCLVLVDCAIMPMGVYFLLWYEAGPGKKPRPGPLSANTVLNIVSATIGGTSVIEWLLRSWKLWKKGSDCQVIGARNRWCFDWFHWWFGLCLLVVVAELVVGTSFKRPMRRLLALPLSSVQAIFGIVLLVLDMLHLCSVPAPMRISSVARGDAVPPGIYPLIEDICAVSGGGKATFREALARRYKASHVFRVLLRRLGAFWSYGALGCAGGTMYLVTEVVDIDIAYALGWTVPFVWACVWTLVTIPYVKYMLAKELRLWRREEAALSMRGPVQMDIV